jgi:FAD/FMN-containing dehydrogenase
VRISSWGGLSTEAVAICAPAFSSEISQCLTRARGVSGARCLVVGNLRSYGDEVLSPSGTYVHTTRCDRILRIDTAADTVTAECGIRIDVLQQRLDALGYMLPVTPGTAQITLGGAIANDVHGKNHHLAGTFGRFVQEFELARTSGEILHCSPAQNPEYFAATIGGMGLTGAITWARIKLRRIASPMLRVTARRFRSLSEFFDLDERHKDEHEYSVAWIDCLARGASLGRGIYSVADHGESSVPPARRPTGAGPYRVSIPCSLSVSPVNRVSLATLNTLYFRGHPTGTTERPIQKWLYPLDTIQHWNRLYGQRGFFQFQCVVPASNSRAAVTELLTHIARRGQGSFLAVLKNFGDKPSPGLMSFPMHGTTLALDFPNRGSATRELLLDLDRLTASAGGRVYPAKDAHCTAESLARGYPQLERFRRSLDPGLESLMSRRLCLTS